ncbi:tetratricopeptide repeat protein [Paenibacillus terrigena]|uniref:tetratricopeptide repeat protein n=1 Tax=Paenibacillus terrigena TaxID=369333 RepID=UPI00036E1A28|nr:tetratricopeptide repeat protein [Paenibacillus terrigena]
MTAEECIHKAFQSILQNDFEQAIDWFEKAIKLDPNNPNHHYKLSMTYMRSNRLSNALEQARLALQYDPSNEGFRTHLNFLLAKQHTQEAEKVLTQTVRETHYAILLLREAVQLDPLAIESYIMLAMAYAELKDYHQAIQVIKEAQQLDPYNRAVENLLEQYKDHLHLDLNNISKESYYVTDD